MLTREQIIEKREAILAVARRHGASEVRIFGSVARGEATDKSDLDLLVRFDPGRSLIDHGMLIEDLETLLGIKVDVVSEGALSPQDRFSNLLAREAVPL